ncbi:MAG: PAS domain-containing sensor histidine kinase, partial [Desulfosarcinaceae bacterium]
CTNQHLRAVLANPAFLRFVGHDAASVVGREIGTFLSIPRIEEMIREVLQRGDADLGELTETFEVEANGEPEKRILGARCMPFRDRRGKTIGAITVLNDITALVKMNRMKSEFVSMVSHEIRGPMNSVLMQLKVVLDGLAGEVSAKQEEILGRASQKIQSLVDMASELLDLARIESGLISQEREQMDMAPLVTEQIDLHRPRARSAGIDLDAAVGPALPKIFAHRRNMEEVVSNLITNAIKYTPAGGRIDVSLTDQDDYLCLKVEDSGLGIAAEDRKKIFQRFYRVKNEKTRYITGTGLGLSLVKSIVDFHHGYIDLESRLGEGSAFSVFLPIAR